MHLLLLQREHALVPHAFELAGDFGESTQSCSTAIHQQGRSIWSPMIWRVPRYLDDTTVQDTFEATSARLWLVFQAGTAYEGRGACHLRSCNARIHVGDASVVLGAWQWRRRYMVRI